ncbi:MAG: proline dehydrogenase [Elusimicrobia bacterium]|nr:MAG: proline dehydrogenase [Elusimicrobiota bacterium]
MRALTFLASRFVAGDTAEDAVDAVAQLNSEGLKATLDFLGEDCESDAQAEAATLEYLSLLDAIHKAGLDCNVSLKLTQFGLNLDPEMAEFNLRRVLERAAATENFVRIDMESSTYTQVTIDLFKKVFADYKNVGIVIQACLNRSEADIAELNALGARVRLCKGAYKEPASVAIQKKDLLNKNYDELAKSLLTNGTYPGIATHDEQRVQSVLSFAKEKNISGDAFEFQMLYGLRPQRWSELVADGWSMRVYVPYGTHWLPYFTRRLRERKENVLFVLKSLVTG